jgi:hypothetical protein
MTDPNLSSIDVSYQSPSVFTPGQFAESLHFAATGTGSSTSPSKPITITRLSESNIAKALLSYDQHDDHYFATAGISDSEYNETEEICSTNPENDALISPLHKDPMNRNNIGGGERYFHQLPSADLMSDDERRDDTTSSPPPPPFSILTSSFTINDLKTVDDQMPPPPPPPPSTNHPPPPYRYSSFGDIESSAKSPHQQSVIQRVESFRSK